MGMSLDAGGHLTHGSKVNVSGTYFNIVPYGVNDEGYIDYDEVLKIAKRQSQSLLLQVQVLIQEQLILRNSEKLQMK